jgi:hypothetical protein
MGTAAQPTRLRRAGLPACGLAFLLAVPGGGDGLSDARRPVSGRS